MALIDKASLLMVPSTYEAGTLYNVLPSGNRAPDSTDQNSGYDQTRADFSFDRGSNAAATRVNSDGLIEKYRENKLLQSNQFDTTWSNVLSGSITSGQSGYDGTDNAWKLSKGATAYRYIIQSLSVSGVYAFSLYAKADTLSQVTIFNDTGGSNPYAKFSLVDGSVVASSGLIDSSATDVGNGWWRLSATFNTTITTARIYPDFAETTAGSIFIQSAQLETGLVATDYLDSGATTAKAGVLIDLPRINYDANGENGSLLLEPSRQQLIQYSEYYSASSWQNVGCTITENQTTSPEGLNNATLIVGTNSGGTRVQDYLGALTGNHTFSIYIKSTGSATRFNFQTNDIGGATFSVPASGAPTLYAEGTNVGNPFIEDAGNGWYRVGFTFTPTGGAVNNYFQLYPDSAGNSSSIYAFGAMAEAGSYATSYIPNHGTSSGVTRAADSCSVTGVSDVIGQTEGTLYIEFDHRYMASYPNEYIIDIEDSTHKLWIRKESAGNTLTSRLIVSGSNVWTIGISATDGIAKIALAYKSGDSAVYYNGTQIGTSSATYSGSSFDDIYFNLAGSANPELKAKNLTLFKERLTNSELATLTTL